MIHARRPSKREGVRECIEGRYMHATGPAPARHHKGLAGDTGHLLGYRAETMPGRPPRQPEPPPWMQPRRPGEVAAVVPPWAQDTFVMPKREGRRPSQDTGRRKQQGEHLEQTQAPPAALPKVRPGCSVAFVSKAVEPNCQYRPYMEDKYCIVDPFMAGEVGNETWGFFAVYDGHGGSAAAELCEAELHKLLAKELRTALKLRRASSPLRDEQVSEALTRSFMKADDQLRTLGAWRYGSTATVCLVRRTPQTTRLHVANVGDSRAIAVDGAGGAERLSMDHRPSDASEARRVREEGGFITMGRLAGELAISRALGDLLLKNSGLSCKPSVRSHDGKRDLALVLASDGLWDYVEEKEVGKLVTECSRQGLEHVAHRLVQEAVRSGSMDNISCLAVFL